MKTTILGLNQQENEVTVTDLNTLLANFQLYYQNLRGLHWNIKGENFFDLHVKFEELYTDAQEKVDLIAERILTLQGHPLHTFKDYLDIATIEVGKDISIDKIAIELIVQSLSKLLVIERKVLNQTSKSNDEGTNAMMSDFISEQEKTIWMMNSWLS